MAIALGLPAAAYGQTGTPETPTTDQGQILDPVGGLLCPVLQPTCVLGSLDFQFITRLKTPNGEIVRPHPAVANVPMPLNVDGDLAPDLIGTLGVLNLGQFSLTIDRAPGEQATLPVRVEAIVDDPSGGTLPRDRINVGYDTRASRAPATWRATATLPDAGDDTKLDVVQDVTGAGASLTAVGGLFDGDALDRKDPMGGALTYTPVPPQATFGFTLGSYMEVRAGATGSAPPVVNGFAEIVKGAREQRAIVGITGLPKQLTVTEEEPGAHQRTVTYTSTATAAAPVARLDVTYTDKTSGVLKTKALVNASRLPAGMTVKQTGARSGTFTATGGSLGSVEVGYANGEPRLLPVTHPYARVVEDGALRSYAGRVDDLVSAAVDASSDDIHADLQLGPGPRKRYRALVELPAAGGGKTVIDGTVSDLPRHLDIDYDAAEGLIDYQAFGESIGQITLDAERPTPFFRRVSRIHGAIGGLPPHATVDLKPDDAETGASFTATPAIGSIDVALSDGRPYPVLAAGRSGAIVRDTPAEFSLAGRLVQVRGASFKTRGPETVATLQTDPIAGLDRQDVDIDVTYEDPNAAPDAVTGPTRIQGTVTDLPSSVTITRAGGHVRYDANDVVPKVTLSARGLPGGPAGGPLDGDVHDVEATLTGVPTQLRLVIAGGEKGVEALEGKIGRADLELWDRDGATAAPPEDDRNKLLLITRDGRLRIQARAFDVTKAFVVKDGETTKVATAFGATPKPLDVHVESGTSDEPVGVDLDIGDIPLWSEITLNKSDGFAATWHAQQPGTDIHLGLSHKDIGADLDFRDLPSDINHLCVGNNDDCNPQSPQEVVVEMVSHPIDDDPEDDIPPSHTIELVPYPFDNDVTIETDANAPIRVADGRVCLPPSDNPLPGPIPGQDAGRTGDVYDTCVEGTAPNRVDLHEVSMKTARLEVNSQNVHISMLPDYPLYHEKYLKVWLATDDYGIHAGRAVVRNEDTSSEVVIETGNSPLRNTGDHFYALKNLSVFNVPPPHAQENQIADCSDLTVEIEIFGINVDVLPHPGELVLGDVCA